MPPANKHLQWTKFEEFGGMWTAGDKLLMPPNAAQVMSGCHPQPQGGIRAFFAPEDLGYTSGPGADMMDTVPGAIGGQDPIGIVMVSSFFVAGTQTFIFVWAFEGDTGGGRWMEQRPDVYIDGDTFLRQDAGDEPFMVDAYPNSGDVGYENGLLPKVVLLRPVSSATSIQPTGFMVLVHDASNLVNVNRGLWQMIDGSTFDHVLTGNFRCVEIHQSRLLLAVNHSVVFSSPGTNDITAGFTNYVNLGGGNVLWMVPLPPSDLLVGTATGGIFNIQGDLSDPVVRTLVSPGSGVNYHHVPVLTRYGAVAITSVGPAVIGTDGAFQPLAESLDREVWQHHGGALAYQEDFLFAPNWLVPEVDEDHVVVEDDLNAIRRNGALAYDFRTGAWFTTSHPDVTDCPNPINITVDPADIFYGSTTDEGGYEPYYPERPKVVVTPPRLIAYPSVDPQPISLTYDLTGPRAHTWEWLSAPLHTPDGREVQLMSVQLGVLAFHEAGGVGSTITVTAENEHGETAQIGVDVRPGRGVYTADVRLDGQYVEIRVESKNHDGGEAPAMEYVSFGWAPGHLPADTTGAPTGYGSGY